ncbi:VWA domain-containing protein [Burkholderiaceae bacterium FT117]|uniref:VWA domain-containing protein n=1 Tax=Zeimonas sediminis TaxID=2944268 RepID=UPI002342FEFD|nr:VWA domain-containing protein [Zeimonas sediminis]MCM5571458.1 VWA domain-containing protein [Zeimonas sediminis]
MKFLWPELLPALAVLPLLVALYVWLLRRRSRAAIRYAGLGLVREAMSGGQAIRRHLPPALFLLAIAAMLVAVARPTAVLTLPSAHETVILAMDVSGSMRADDVEPTRMAAAQAAARAFIDEQPRSTRIGIVTFGGAAALVQPPTQSREDLLAALERFEYQRGTAVGSGLLVSLKTIFPDVEFDLRKQDPRPSASGPAARAAPLDRGRPLGAPGAAETAKSPPQPVPAGSYQSAVIILLTDGQTTTGPDPIASAWMTAERGVRVYTVGIGTPNGEILIGEGWSMRVRLDEETLKGIADITRGEYFYAGTAEDLKKVYESLTTRVVLETRETEVTALFSAAGAALAVLSALLSMLWFRRVF